MKKDISRKKMLGVDLKHIKRVLVTEGEMGYKQGLHHYFLPCNVPMLLYNRNLPIGIVNLPSDPESPVVMFVCSKWYSNIETVDHAPGDEYKMCILVYFEDEYDELRQGEHYDN